MTAERPQIAVVVCTHLTARWPQLLECLASVEGQRVQPAQVVVVVDGNAELVERLQRRDGPETVVSLAENGGLSAARNAGIAACSSEWVAFLDDDAVAEPTWLESLHKACRESGAVGAGGLSRPLWEAGFKPRAWPEEMLWVVGCSYKGLPEVRTPVRNVFGGCCLMRRELFDLVGGFDTQLGRQLNGAGGGEEAEFCLRVTAALPDAFFIHEPDAVILHRVSLERSSFSYLWRRCFAEGADKARVMKASGRGRALNAETTFVLRALTGGLVAHLRHPADGGLGRAAFLALGISAACLGFFRASAGFLRAGMRSGAPSPDLTAERVKGA